MSGWAILMTGIIGLVTGAIGSLVAPWVHWGIEKRRIIFNNHRKIIDDCREYTKRGDFELQSFAGTAEYSAVAQYISLAIKTEIESHDMRLVVGGNSDDLRRSDRRRFLEEIAALERRWKLV